MDGIIMQSSIGSYSGVHPAALAEGEGSSRRRAGPSGP
jgi:hypothetical protein